MALRALFALMLPLPVPVLFAAAPVGAVEPLSIGDSFKGTT